jgi:catechol 2,3-dioxygenase-like lactoylglutathione lyase family enzyme
MPLVTGLNHVAVITRDLDRFVGFYREVFDASFEELTDPRGRHGFVHLADSGPMSVLHAFEVGEEITGPFDEAPNMFRRGQIDHLAIEASSESALCELRDRLAARGASDGSVRLFGDRLLSIHVVDPDGMHLEVCCPRTGDYLEETDFERMD